MSAEWWREYRARNRDRLNAAARARRAVNGRGDRTAERARDRERRRIAAEANNWTLPDLHDGHDLFDHAKRLVASQRLAKPDRRTYVYDATHEDMVSEVVLALIEGRSGLEAALAFRAAERDWAANHWTGISPDGWRFDHGEDAA